MRLLILLLFISSASAGTICHTTPMGTTICDYFGETELQFERKQNDYEETVTCYETYLGDVICDQSLFKQR